MNNRNDRNKGNSRGRKGKMPFTGRQSGIRKDQSEGKNDEGRKEKDSFRKRTDDEYRKNRKPGFGNSFNRERSEKRFSGKDTGREKNRKTSFGNRETQNDRSGSYRSEPDRERRNPFGGGRSSGGFRKSGFSSRHSGSSERTYGADSDRGNKRSYGGGKSSGGFRKSGLSSRHSGSSERTYGADSDRGNKRPYGGGRSSGRFGKSGSGTFGKAGRKFSDSSTVERDTSGSRSGRREKELSSELKRSNRGHEKKESARKPRGRTASGRRAGGTGKLPGTAPVKKNVSESKDGIRLNKFIADSGLGSRRKIDEMITEGRVVVNGKTVTELGVRIDPENDKIQVDGESLRKSIKKTYILLNKPKGIITSVSDEKNRTTVIDLVDSKERIFPVGRLDYDTSGLLLLTNDGELANLLMHPSGEIRKTYHVKLSKPLDEKHKLRIEEGVKIDRELTSPCEVKFLSRKNRQDLLITIHEGKNRQVRRIFEKYGYFVRDLERTEYAGLSSDGMKAGTWRSLSPEEVSSLYRQTGLSGN